MAEWKITSPMPVESDTRKLEACACVCSGMEREREKESKECVNNGDIMCMY